MRGLPRPYVFRRCLCSALVDGLGSALPGMWLKRSAMYCTHMVSSNQIVATLALSATEVYELLYPDAAET